MLISSTVDVIVISGLHPSLSASEWHRTSAIIACVAQREEHGGPSAQVGTREMFLSDTDIIAKPVIAATATERGRLTTQAVADGDNNTSLCPLDNAFLFWWWWWWWRTGKRE